MLEKLFKLAENNHIGLVVIIEYTHVIDYVVSIYRNGACSYDNKPLIRTEGDLDDAVAEAYVLLKQYLYLTEEERCKIDTITFEIKYIPDN